VSDGQTIVQIADLSRLWLEAKVPEAEIGRMSSPAGAFFRVQGDEQATVLEVGRNARLVTSGGLVDRDTRTIPVVFEFPNFRGLRVGTNLQVNLYTGRVLNGPTVPASALVDDGGQPVVFVQLGGESFERRAVQPGFRDGDLVAIARGLKAGERVVTRGAYDVRLSAAAPASAGHGHAH
jgi:multidrug efflux pump subunit AcrA (membrane-fusion protein)